MATKADLEPKEAECNSVKDYCLLAMQALDEPKDEEYAKELLDNAEGDAAMPADYIAIAEVYVKLGDKETAEEQYEEAEDACFEAHEWAALANSVAVHLKDKGKTEEYLENAADDAKNTEDILKIAGYYQEHLDNSEKASELLSGIESQLKEIKDYFELAENLAGSGDKDTAKTFYKKGEKLVDEIEEAVEYAKGIHKLFEDKEWIAEVLEDVEDDAQFTKDAIALAKAFMEYCDDKDKAEEMLDQAKDLAMTGEEQIDLALGSWNIFKNKEVAVEGFKAGIKDVTDKDKLLEYAKIIALELEDKELSKEYYSQAESKMSSAADLMKLAKAVLNDVKDKDYAKEIFSRAEESLEMPSDLMVLAKELISSVDDKEGSKRVYEKALEKTEKFDGYLELADDINGSLKDEELIRRVLKEADKNAESSPNMMKVGEKILTLLEDKEFATELFLQSEENVTSLEEMTKINQTIKKHFPDDEEWIKRVDDKLKMREANQDTYNAYQNREDSVKFVKDLLVIIDDMMEELKDKYYAKKLFKKGHEMLEILQFNVDNYGKLCYSIKRHIGDTEWIVKILDLAAEKKINFLFDYVKLSMLTQDIIDDKERANSMVSSYLKKAEEKTEKLNEDKVYQMATLAEAVCDLLDDKERAMAILIKAETNDPDHLALAKIARSYKHIGEVKKSDDMVKHAYDKCTNVIQMHELSELLLNTNFDEKLIKNLYHSVVTKLTTPFEKLTWTEGLIDIFGDRSAAKANYENIENEFSSYEEKDRYTFSKKNKLEMAYFD